jgi:hypothetical protein
VNIALAANIENISMRKEQGMQRLVSLTNINNRTVSSGSDPEIEH